MFNNYDIKEIRCLPMDSQDEFINEDEVREFFNTGLAEYGGRYYYQQRGINLKDTNALVLFQYNGNIVAYGIFITREKEVVTGESHGKQITYNGYNLFDIESIHNIEKISSEEFRALNPAFKRFSQSMQKTDIKLLNPLLELLEKKRKAFEDKK